MSKEYNLTFGNAEVSVLLPSTVPNRPQESRMNPNIQIVYDQKRGCGYRKTGGYYLRNKQHFHFLLRYRITMNSRQQRDISVGKIAQSEQQKQTLIGEAPKSRLHLISVSSITEGISPLKRGYWKWLGSSMESINDTEFLSQFSHLT